MVEIPTKNAAAYTGLFQQLSQFAAKHNDQPGVDANAHTDRVELNTQSPALYANGDTVSLQAQLSQGQVLSVQVEINASERDPYRASLSLEQTADGLTGRELLHDERGLCQRQFSIHGGQVVVESETQNSQPYRLENDQEKRKMGEKLGDLTDGLQYLLGPSFPKA
ncbi:hypothetical protein IV102_09080 [bacterium]|nr:hypothetical protein [bacterium]